MHNNIALDKNSVHGNFESSLCKPLLQWLQVVSLLGHQIFSVKKQDNIQKIIENILLAQ